MELLASNIDKEKGPDGIPQVFFKKLAWELSYPLTLLYNTSISSGIFPSQLKQANIIPIFKQGDSEKAENYRPISLLCHTSKIFESIMHKHNISQTPSTVLHR